MSERRPARVGQLLQSTIGQLLLHDVRDPRLAGVVVNDVRVTPDLKIARVYVRHLAVEPDERAILSGLTKAGPFLRRRVGEEVGLRWVPELRFEYDRLADEAARIEGLLATVGRDDDDAEEGP